MISSVNNSTQRSVRDQVKSSIANTKQAYPQFDPRLAILLVGSRSDSTTYVKTKDKAANEVSLKENGCFFSAKDH